MSCVFCELVLWQHVLCIVGIGAVAACLVCCVSHILFRMGIILSVFKTVTLAMNKVFSLRMIV